MLLSSRVKRGSPPRRRQRNLHYKVIKFGGLKETLLGGEGLVTQITGPGDVHIQTKNMKEFVDWLWTLPEPRVQAKAR